MRIAVGLAIVVALSVPLTLVGLPASWLYEGKPDLPQNILGWLALVGWLDLYGLVALVGVSLSLFVVFQIFKFLYQLGGVIVKR